MHVLGFIFNPIFDAQFNHWSFLIFFQAGILLTPHQLHMCTTNTCNGMLTTTQWCKWDGFSLESQKWKKSQVILPEIKLLLQHGGVEFCLQTETKLNKVYHMVYIQSHLFRDTIIYLETLPNETHNREWLTFPL